MATFPVRETDSLAARPRPRKPLAARPKPHRYWGRVAVSAGLVVVLALVVLAGRTWGDRVKAFFAPPDQSLPQSEKWVASNLPTDARIVADATVRADLTKAGVPAWDLVDSALIDAQPTTEVTGWRVYDYVVSTPRLRTALTTGGQVRAALLSSVVVASFGYGPARVEVRELAAQGVQAAAARTQQAEQASAEAGRQLLTSPNVRLSPDAAQQAASGMVDGRLMSVLVGLGSQFSLTVGAFSDPDPGGLYENRLRQVSLIVVDGALVAGQSTQVAAVTNWLAAQQGEFRPSAVAVHGNQLLVRFRVLGPHESGVL
jgi:hypothetical protein